jgi:tetratricopeptide (TPR) repeat protein
MKTKWMLVMVFGVIAPLCTAASKPISVELREARYTEEMKGDLDQAIKLYEKIAFNAEADRGYIAEALFRLGTCYAKKGIRDKAEVQFKLVVTQYTDQTDFVARAQKELTTLQGKPDAVVAQAVQTISTCAEGDPRVKAAIDTLKGRDSAVVITELTKHLDSQIHTIRRAAIYILWQGQFPDIQPAVAKLTELCKHPEEYTRGMAALALGQNKVASAYEALCTMTTSDSSPYARRSAAYALGLLGKPEAKSVLDKAAQDPDTLVGDNAKAALGMLEPGKLAVPAVKATGPIETDEPVVIKTIPQVYADDVSPTLNRLSVTFNQTMFEGNFAWVTWDGPFPETTGKPSFDATKRICTLPVKLEPGKVYMVGINIGKFNSFQSHDGVTARPYALVFATQSADGKPTPIPQDLLDRAKQVNDAVAQYIEQSKPQAPITEAQELANDDGKPADKLSISGSGHGVKFECPGERGILRAVKIYGSRYGSAEAPKEDFNVWVCDERNKVLKDFTFPYSKFVRGRDKWVVLPTGAFEIPKQFVIFVGFNPERTKGVYVYYDKESSGKSLQGLPTTELKPFDKGDWLIRAVISGTGKGQTESSQGISKETKLEAEKIRAQAWQLWQQQKFAEAEPLFQQAVEKDPSNANAWNGYGWTLFNLGRPEAAKEAFEKCIEIDSRQGAAWNGLGWISKGQGQIDEAIKNWEQALKVLPNGTAAMNGLAMTCMEKQDYAKAAQVYQRWLKVEPNSPEAKVGLEKAQGQISK